MQTGPGLPAKLPQRRIQSERPLLSLCDCSIGDAISGQEGFESLEQILRIDPQAVVIFMTAYKEDVVIMDTVQACLAQDYPRIAPNPSEHFPDKLHPDRVASLEMAKCAYRAMTGNSKEFQLQDFRCCSRPRSVIRKLVLSTKIC